MDPNACIRIAAARMGEGNAEETAAAFRNLADWLESGGFPPDPAVLAEAFHDIAGWIEAMV